MKQLIDTHFHLDFVEEQKRQSFISAIANEQIDIIAQTLLPTQYQLIYQQYPVALALGCHPWHIQDRQQMMYELQLFEQLLPTTHYIGEIGLDFAPSRLEQVDQGLQVETFTRIIHLLRCYEQHYQHPFIVSIHSVRSATQVIDILEAQALYQGKSQVILHYFNGTSDELTRHIRNGGWLSVHPKMLQTKKGRAYIQQVPLQRLLLETDLPIATSETDTIETQHPQVIHQLVEQLSELLKRDMRPVLLDNQEQLIQRMG
ncbi:TatD family hydrolase [Aerococcaceae bacterium zg-BR22]|uniref:TatD family hydrolase n=1 Tax=Aerococcaceae bacterium zg-1292 TaxID=2774330 RepID=UPI004062B973|nr:TatD family hydrolase [Aerococcaceae bacterium zg-BR22]